MNRIVKACRWLSARIGESKAQLRLSLRVTVSAIATLILAELLNLPLGGLWAVLTAVIVTQMSIGSSLKATIEYSVGTLGGAIYACAIATIVPPDGAIAAFGDLAVVIAPLAFLAAFNPNFRVAPFTAVIVVVGSAATHTGPLASALYRVIEVEFGGAIGLVVSYLVLPERAHALARRDAARMVDLMARSLPELIIGVLRGMDEHYNTAAAAVRHERLTLFSAAHDQGPLSRTLLRLRHDFVILGRASAAPLPQVLRARLEPSLTEIDEAAADYLRTCSVALTQRRGSPSATRVDAAFDGFASEVATLRREGATRGLPAEIVEHFFMLGFVFDQIREHFRDLARCIGESNR
jgi:uncharacterized membrane protein YccC